MAESDPSQIQENATGSGAVSNSDDTEADVPLLRDSDIPTLNAALEEADIVLEVLDARDPLPFRSKWVEDNVKSRPGKTHGFILNKIGELTLLDLVS